VSNSLESIEVNEKLVSHMSIAAPKANLIGKTAFYTHHLLPPYLWHSISQ